MKEKFLLLISYYLLIFCLNSCASSDTQSKDTKNLKTQDSNTMTEDEKNFQYNSLITSLNSSTGEKRESEWIQLKDSFPETEFGFFANIRSECNKEYNSPCFKQKLSLFETKFPDSFLIPFAKGNAKDDEKKYKEAISFYTISIKMNPEFSASYANRSNAKRQLTDFDGAINDLREYVRRCPEDMASATYDIAQNIELKEEKLKIDDRLYCVEYKKAYDSGYIDDDAERVRANCGDLSVPFYSLQWFHVSQKCTKLRAAEVTTLVDQGCLLTGNPTMNGIHLDCASHKDIGKINPNFLVLTSTKESCNKLFKILTK